MENLPSYSWPGNVRELQNVIERAVVLAVDSVVQIDNSMLQAEQATQQSLLGRLENVERNHILRALNETRWVIQGSKGAAEILGRIRVRYIRAWRSWESGDLRIPWVGI